MGLGTCDICQGLHYTSECEHRLKKTTWEQVMNLLEPNHTFDLQIGFFPPRSGKLCQMNLFNKMREKIEYSVCAMTPEIALKSILNYLKEMNQ